MVEYKGFIFQYCLNPWDSKPIMEINKQIGTTDEEEGINGDLFSREITILDGLNKEEISIYINSHGGRVDDGWTIFTAISRCKTPVIGYIAGLAASIAGVIFQACSKRIMYEHSILMVHNPAIQGEDTEVEEDPMLQVIKSSLKIMLKKKNKLSDENLDKMMNEETWMLAKAALDNGFADEILHYTEDFQEENMKYIIENKVNLKDLTKKFSLVVNNIISEKIKNKNTMKEKLLKILDLSDKSTEKEVINAVNKAFPFLFNMGEETMEGIKGADGKVIPGHLVNDDEMMDYKKAYMDLKSVMDKMTEDKACMLVENAIKDGKIVNETRSNWLSLAKKDYSSTELILNSLNYTKKNSSIENVVNKVETDKFLSEKKTEIVEKAEEKTEKKLHANDILLNAFNKIGKIK